MELAIQIAAVGIGVVFLTLVMLYLVLTALSALMNRNQRNSDYTEPTPAPLSGIPPQHLAAIAGALASMGAGGRIHSINVIPSKNWQQKSLTETIDQGRIT